MANAMNDQYRSSFDVALNDLERATREQAIQTTLWILQKLDGETLVYLLDDCMEETNNVLRGACKPNGAVVNGFAMESARLALEGLVSENKKAVEKDLQVKKASEFLRRSYNFIVTHHRKGKIFFRLMEVAPEALEVWLDFGKKTYLADWESEAIWENSQGQKIGRITRSELIGLQDSGVKLHPDLQTMTEQRWDQ